MNYILINRNDDDDISSGIDNAPKNDNYLNKENKKKRKKIIHKILGKKLNINILIIFLILILFSIFIMIEYLLNIETKYNNNIIQRLINSINIKNNENIIKTDINITDKKIDIKTDNIIEKIKNITSKVNKTDNIIEENKNITEVKIPKKEDIYKEEIFSSRDVSYRRAKSFLEANNKGILIQPIPQNLTDNPIASAVIPVYNSRKYISRAIKSIQNQNISNIEIVLINDFSTDDTLSFIEDIQKEDQRIKIIKNKKNMGILYSRCIGALHATGKYIFPLDNDDMFLDKDVFDTVTKIAEKGDFDIVEFKAITTFNYISGKYRYMVVDSAFSGHKLNLVLYQPELGRFPLQPARSLDKYHLESVFLWAKCFKTEIYQKAVDKLGEKKYSRFMLRHEDILANYFLFNTARSYKFIGKYGVNHIERDASASQQVSKVDEDIYNLFLLDVAIDFTLDTIDNKKILVNLIVFLLSRNSLKDTLNVSDEIKQLFLSCLDKILKMNNITNEHKNTIKNMVEKLDFIDYSV